MTLRTEKSLRPLVLDMSSIASIRNPAEVGPLLNEAINEERAIDGQLEEMLQRRDDFAELLQSAVRETNEVLELVQTDAEQLISSVGKAADVAEGISSTVKSLDTMQTNVKSALDHINLLTDRSTCMLRVRESMEQKNYEAAAECIAKFHALESSISQPAEVEQKKAIEECEQVLLNEIRGGIQSAIQGDNAQEVLRLSLLFLPLNRKEEGRQALMEFLKSLVARQGHEEYQKLSNALESRASTPGFVDRISNLFRFVARTIEDHNKTFVDSFDEHAFLDLIQQLYMECDTYASRIIQRFLEARSVKQTVQEINLSRKKVEGMVPAGSTVLDPRKAETALLEILGLVRRCEEFIGLLVQQMKDVSHTLSITPSTKLHESKIGSLSRDLCGFYVTLEEFYMEESIKKAININAAVSGSMISSMVDDVFFICRKVASRAISSRNVPCVCAVISLMNTLLSKDYTTALQRPLSSGSNAFIHAALSNQTEMESSQFSLFLNNVQVSLSYANKLKSELEQRIQSTFQASNENEIASSLLDDLGVVVSSMEKLLVLKCGNISDALMTQLLPYFQEVANMSYQLDEQAFETLSDIETWTHRLLSHIRRASSSLEAFLTTENLTKILDQLMLLVVSRCEAQFMQKTFNQLGGLQFDRDIRILVTHFSEICQSSIRDKFSRLSQMATILCFESVEEMLDYWGDEGGSINWRLSPAEIKTILRLRNDFSETSISALLL